LKYLPILILPKPHDMLLLYIAAPTQLSARACQSLISVPARAPRPALQCCSRAQSGSSAAPGLVSRFDSAAGPIFFFGQSALPGLPCRVRLCSVWLARVEWCSAGSAGGDRAAALVSPPARFSSCVRSAPPSSSIAVQSPARFARARLRCGRF
jgi:hypothetical protein